MRSTLVLSVVAAAAVVSAQDCNPSYNVAGSTECFTNCNVQAGSAIIGTWTMDHTSKDFLPSLALMCNKSGPNYMTFMTNAGMCMAACAGDDPNLFNAEFQGACAWWNTHKDDTCAAETTTTTQAQATTTAAATTTTAAAVTTTTVAAVTTVDPALSSGVSAIATVLSTGVPVASANISASANVSAIANATATGGVVGAPSGAADNQTPNGANKIQLSGYALALVAGLGYLAF